MWDEMVEEFGEKRALELLKECKAEIKLGLLPGMERNQALYKRSSRISLRPTAKPVFWEDGNSIPQVTAANKKYARTHSVKIIA